jgi:hypothetical protein
MAKSRPGSLGYQMMKALQGIFKLGASRHRAKHRKQTRVLITSISTKHCMSADVHQFVRFVRSHWPTVKMLDQITPEMAQAYIDELVR